MRTEILRKQSSGGSVAGVPHADGADLDLQSTEQQSAHLEADALKQKYEQSDDLPSIAYFTLDARGRIIDADGTAAELLGLDRSALRECHLALLVAPESRPDFDALWELVFKDDSTHTSELRFLRDDRTTVDVLLEACAGEGDGADDRRVRMAALDIMSRKMMLMALQEVYGNFEKLVKDRARRIAEVSIPPPRPNGRQEAARIFGDAVVTTDVNGYVTYLNLAAEHYTGWNSMDAAGMPASKVFVIDDAGSEGLDPVRLCLRDERTIALQNGSRLDSRIGGAVRIRGSVTPIHDADGQTIGATLTFREASPNPSTDPHDRSAGI